MGVTGTLRRKMLLMKPFSVEGFRSMSKLATPVNHRKTTIRDAEPAPAEAEERRNWMPHPRTGIYFPVGQEWVMEGIPNNAASLDCTLWFRSIDGVVDHKPDDHHFLP